MTSKTPCMGAEPAEDPLGEIPSEFQEETDAGEPENTKAKQQGKNKEQSRQSRLDPDDEELLETRMNFRVFLEPESSRIAS